MASFNWTRSIGDPTLAAWLTVAFYLVTSFICWRSARRAELEGSHRSNEPFAWRCIAVLLLVLGADKQLNLIAAVTAFGRADAHLQGWYDRRQPVQMVLIALLAMSCASMMTVLLIWMRRAPIPTWLALTGTLWLVTFVLIRAVSYHYVDRFLFERILGFRWNSVIEIGGIGVVLLASLWRQKIYSKQTSAFHMH
jgi:hypothetical protein